MYILIVEDSHTQAKALRDMLKRHGYETAIAKDGKKAFELIRVKKPALIISDVIMPVMDGYELCEILKKIPHTVIFRLFCSLPFQTAGMLHMPFRPERTILSPNRITRNISSIG